MSQDFIEIGSGGILSREGLISIVLGTDPGVWHSEDFVARELSPTVALLTYRTARDPGGRRGPADRHPPRIDLAPARTIAGGWSSTRSRDCANPPA